MKSGKAYFVKRIVKGVLFFITLFVIVSALVMWLWNWLLPDLFELQTISFWQAAGLLLLSKILFGGFRKPGGYGHKKHWHWKRKWESLSDEEKQKLKDRFKDYGVS